MSSPAESSAGSPAGSGPRLEIRGLRKSFGPNAVLRGLDLTVEAGEIHALVGGNGAGKSTLSKIIAGIEQEDAGTMTLDGAPFAPRHRRGAQAAGVVMVMQELGVLPTLTLAENLFLGELPRRWGGWIHRERLREAARVALARVGLGDLDPDLPAAGLGVGQQQLVEIAAGLAQPCSLLILDEPTAALTGPEAENLFRLLRGLRERGTSIIYISHRLDEIADLADRVSVLCDGRLVATRSARSVSRDEIVRLMSGGVTEPATPAPRTLAPREVVLRVSRLRAGNLVRDISFELRRGEIVGLGGLIGSGRTELLRAIFGADSRDGGAISLGTELRPFVPREPADAIAAGLAFVPEDRKQDGIFGPLGIAFNAGIGLLPRRSFPPGWIDSAVEARRSEAWLKSLEVRYADADQPMAELSGGNQQKIVVGRWLPRAAAIWLIDEPTRGVDAYARERLHGLLRERAADGAAILVASSDYEELAMLCDRVLVLSRGLVAAEFDRRSLTPSAFVAAAFSRHLAGQAN